MWQNLYCIRPCQKAHLCNASVTTGEQSRRRRTDGLNLKNPLISNWKIREIDGSRLCLQWFDKFWICRECNDWKKKLCESAESCLEKLVKSHQVNYIFGEFQPYETTVRGVTWRCREWNFYQSYVPDLLWWSSWLHWSSCWGAMKPWWPQSGMETQMITVVFRSLIPIISR